MEMEYGVELLVLVENVLGEAYILFHEKFATYKVAAWTAGEVELLHVCAAADCVAEGDSPLAFGAWLAALGYGAVVELQYLWHFAMQFFDALPVFASRDKCVVAIDKLNVCALGFIYAAVACCTRATVRGSDEPYVHPGKRIVYP